ncbi:MAG: NAD-glutamate dehydrogenase [Vicinamibacteria bacterium]|nr:NAD-glutamate dehydrogenase [Vicinamibacteria bacterium]
MLTIDPQQRALRLAEVEEILSRESAPEDRDLLVSFSRAFLGELPDRLMLGLTPAVIATRVADYFRFFGKEMPPSGQLYKGLPGIHVVARQAEDSMMDRTLHGRVLPHETTIVETHTIDAPFIFESLKNYFRKSGIRVFSAIHPILSVRRQWERIVAIGGPKDEGAKELFCHFRIERIDSKERLRRIEHEIHSVLKCVFLAVEDFKQMRKGVLDLAPRLKGRHGDAMVPAAQEFLRWLMDDNYILLGSAHYKIGTDGSPDLVHESAAGVFTDPDLLPVVFPGLLEELEPHLVPAADDERIVEVDYCNHAQAIYHLEPIDDVVIREWNADGTLAGATLLLGRLAMGAFTEKSADIPLLKGKHDWLLESSGAAQNSYAYREIRALFNRFPKRELFYSDRALLKETFDRIVHMAGDEDVAVHVRRARGYDALVVAFARSRYSFRVERELKGELAAHYGPISFATSADCGAVSVMLFYFESSQLERPLDESDVRGRVESHITTWEDQVASELVKAFGEREGRRLLARYVTDESRSGLYREATPPPQVPEDLARLEQLESQLELRVLPRSAETATLKLYSVRPLGLTETLRTLSNLGLTATEEMRIPLELPDGRKAFLYRFELEASPQRIAAMVADGERFAAALRALDEQRATDDAMNSLVLDAGLGWRDVEALRTYRNHLLQIRSAYNAETVSGVLSRNPGASAALFALFAARFDPRLVGDREAAMTEAAAGVRKALEAVKSLAEDEVLRALLNQVQCTLRTNFYQRPERPVISIKVDSRKVEGMVSPRPMVEIYVHSRLLEGIHLRGGKVARGGLRWSDRHDDFRTEILGLMKTQMVKNAIIVPVGSKGGFVLKGDVPARPALDAYLIDRYREFISGLLDVTDNIVNGAVLHPPEVIRHDGDDPYLVVAADKGTAHLSDTANSVSAQYGFWLGDAFASGGSAGYDHKKMGITARGAWECVKHLFHNLGQDIQKEPFTAVGIGDMSGDVFGNGVLLSPVMKLVAAFNHMHIFIDPEPDIAKSFAERQRMFDLPRSTWKDYDASIISAGGGIFDRGAKSIPVSPQMKKLLDLEGDTASGEEVMKKILTAKVDLFYNGGIGTYVRSSNETDAQVGDRANDRLRITGSDLRCRVVGEGGNLGFTQRGRLEYSIAGGNINTDALDNSGGVDTSDHEVNIKILLDPLVRQGVIKGKEERNKVLAEMTNDVGALVLADNANQARAITLDGLRSARSYEDHVARIEEMLAAGVLSRKDDAIPTRDELLALPSRDRGLPRPLLAVLLGITKMWAFDQILETKLPESELCAPFLDAYFPPLLRERFREHFKSHPLRREIVGTTLVNDLVNNAGIAFVSQTMAATKASFADVVAAYVEADRAAGRGLRERILAAGRPAAETHAALVELQDALAEVVRTKLTGGKADAAKTIGAVGKKLGF